jgi:CTP synthase
MAKIVVVTGGVVSSLGKGIAAASLGVLLKARGFRVTLQKLDPYLNIDPGTMSPFQHGEVYVTDDGDETDLDPDTTSGSTGLGHTQPQRHGGSDLRLDPLEGASRHWAFAHRAGDSARHRRSRSASRSGAHYGSRCRDRQIGGTVGDIESLPFRGGTPAAARASAEHAVHSRHARAVHQGGRREKTKPTQHSVKELREIGIQPDILSAAAREKLGTTSGERSRYLQPADRKP